MKSVPMAAKTQSQFATASKRSIIEVTPEKTEARTRKGSESNKKSLF